MSDNAVTSPRPWVRHLSLVLRLLFAAAGVAYIIYKVNWHDHVITAADGTQHLRRGFLTQLQHANVHLLLLGLAVVALVYPLQTLRWWLLMRARGLGVTLWRTFRVAMVGNFFNYCMPGTTGGDVVKAYYAVRRNDRRTDAVMSIIFDRAVGLTGLIMLAALSGLFMLDNPLARTVTLYIWLGIAVLVVGAVVYFSPHLRRWVGLEWLLARLPGRRWWQQIDAAAVAYRRHLRVVAATIVLSLPVHVCLALGTTLGGYALGMHRPLGLMLTVVPLLFLAGTVPLTYQGLGVMEGLGIALLAAPPMATNNQIVGALLLVRMYMVFYALLGALFLLRGDIHMHPQQPAAEPSP